jgi:hypothetical protein
MNEEKTEKFSRQVQHIHGDMTYPFKWRLNLGQVNAQGFIGLQCWPYPFRIFS